MELATVMRIGYWLANGGRNASKDMGAQKATLGQGREPVPSLQTFEPGVV
jgi:hypothetical protein